MMVSEIMAALTPYTGKFPKEAVEAAIAQREETAPLLVRALEEVAGAPEKFAPQEYMLHLFASYLLAEFRDKRAYRPLTRILATPGDLSDQLFGDTITEGLMNILASVYDGDPEPLQRVIESEDAYEFTRGAAVDTLIVLTHTGQIPREEVVAYCQSLFRGKLRREYNQVWNALTGVVEDLPAPELIEDLRKAYEDDLVDPGYADLEGVEEEAFVPFANKASWKTEKYTTLISDTVSELSSWASFRGDDPPEPPLSLPEAMIPETWLDSPEESEPEDIGWGAPPGAGLRLGPKIGRNDPCPCGSGKKYKKCCLHA